MGEESLTFSSIIAYQVFVWAAPAACRSFWARYKNKMHSKFKRFFFKVIFFLILLWHLQKVPKLGVKLEPHLQPIPQLVATLDPYPTEQGQESNPQPHGS